MWNPPVLQVCAAAVPAELPDAHVLAGFRPDEAALMRHSSVLQQLHLFCCAVQPWGQGAQSRTESRAGGRRRAQQAQRLRQRQEANQERGAGVLDERPGVSQAQRLSDAKLNLRRQQLEAAVTGQQPELLAQEPEPPPPPQQQQHNLQLAADSPQHPENDARASRVPLMQHPPLRAPQQPTAALRREIAEAKAALAAVGGSKVRAAARAATRPLIRRQPVGARAALELLAVSSAAGGSRSGPSPPGQAASSSAATGEADDYRSRLPDNKDWKAAAQAAAGGKGLSGRDGNGRGSGRGRGSGAGGSRYQGRQERDSNIGDGDGEGVGEGDGDDDEDEDGDERRSSPIVELSLLLAECVQHGLRTIAFCKSR
jgi:DEAD/DEAH box helicase domain-containing protein